MIWSKYVVDYANRFTLIWSRFSGRNYAEKILGRVSGSYTRVYKFWGELITRETKRLVKS